MARVSIRNVWKQYGEHVVLENLRLEVPDNEFVTIVGASGCGKTTSCGCCWVPSSRRAGRS